VAAAVVLNTYAPPATVRLQPLHDQMPTQVRFIDSCVGQLIIELDHIEIERAR
jgi:hypothetical protein